MERDLRQELLTNLLNKADLQGYVTFNDIMDCADASSLSIQDFDWLTSAVTTKGILVYDEAPTTNNRIVQESNDDGYADYAQSDYEYIYDKIVELDESLKNFVTEVRNIKPPQWKEFSELKYQVAEGNQYARDRMIEMHLRNALRIALQRAETYDMDIQDAVGEACIGLITAVDKYDPDTNGAFGSYASMWILQNISRQQPTQRTLMYYPVHKKDSYFLAYPILKAAGYAGDLDALNDTDVYDLLANKLLFTNKQTEDAIYATIPFESYENLVNVFEKHEFEKEKTFLFPQELLSDDMEEKIVAVMMQKQVYEVLHMLTKREQQVLELRNGLNDGVAKTLEEVGMVFNITRERIRQIEAKALRKLRHPSRSQKLRDYIDYMPAVKSEEN